VAFYDKMHLVPFGEYLPLSGLLARSASSISFPEPGMPARGAPFGRARPAAGGAVICYEAIFSGAAVEEGAARPQWLLNVTNDGWSAHQRPLSAFRAGATAGRGEGLPWCARPTPGYRDRRSYGRVLQQLPLGSKA